MSKCNSVSLYDRFLHRYTHSRVGAYFKAASATGERADRACGSVEHFFRLLGIFFQEKGNACASQKCGSVASGFSDAGGTLGVFRTIFPLEQLITGKMFFEQDPSSNPTRSRWRSFLSIAQDVQILAARILSILTWLHNKGVCNLGKYADKMTKAILALWESVIFIEIRENAIALKNLDPEDCMYDRKFNKHLFDLLISIADSITIIFDFGYLMSGKTALAFGSAACFGDKIAFLIGDVIFPESSFDEKN